MSETPSTDDTERAVAAMQGALRSVGVMLPHLAGLARLVRVAAHGGVGTAGVFASGRLVVNPAWFLGLQLPERIFVAAHELLHLALRTHERCAGSDARLFNIAHDYIINDMLRTALGTEVPAGGLDWPGAAALSAEKIVAELRSRQARGQALPQGAWSGPPLGTLGEALARAGLGPGGSPDASGMDALDDRTERRWFPDDGPGPARAREIEAAGDRALALGVWRERAEKAFTPPAPAPGDADSALVRALDARVRPPWELALQRWLEDAAPGPRSFARPSRRQGDRQDVVLAGRRREGWTLNLVLDTSGSMWSELARVLGVLKGFCEGVGVAAVRILQCGDTLEADEIVPVEALDRYRILGGAGGDLKPGLRRLALDPEVEAALVITDGCEDYPPEPMPYGVLWAIVGEVPDFFRPGYGRILRIAES